MNGFSAAGGSMDQISRTALAEALANMAVLKNVPLTPAEREEAVRVVVADLKSVQGAMLSPFDRESLAARTRAINTLLDVKAVARLMRLVMDIEGKSNATDPVVQAVTWEIVGNYEAGLANPQCAYWPDPAALVMSRYAGKPRGPTVGVREDGTVCTRWWLGMIDFHRDPREGPANIEEKGGKRHEEYWVEGKRHRPHEDGPAVIVRDSGTGVIVEEQYWQDGKRHRAGGPAHIRRDETGKVLLEAWYRDGALHRDHREGPAYIDEDFDGLGIHCEEYHENGKWHRPSEIGPAIVNRDCGGRVVREFYVEHGKLHRDPRQGPAWSYVCDARTDASGGRAYTEVQYHVRGQYHRDPCDGPALTRRDNETGVLLLEEYWRDGFYHRESGPVSIERTPEGVVTFEYHVPRDGDPGDRPSHIRRDAQGRLLSETWFIYPGAYRHASEGPGYVSYDPATGTRREEYFLDDSHQPASHGPAIVARDRNGKVLWEKFWDGERMEMKNYEPAAGAGGHG